LRLLAFNNPRNTKFLLVILSVITTALCILFIENHHQTLALEKELDRINYELHLKQVTHDRIIKEHEEQAKKHKEQVETLKLEVLAKLKQENGNRY
jgi:hypothetical protein